MIFRYSIIAILVIFAIAGIVYFYLQPSDHQEGWSEYLGNGERSHYSPLTQITPSNINNLKPVWEYHTGDSGQVQCNPIIVNGRLYGVTATAEPFSLDAATGKQIWRVHDTIDTNVIVRGVAYWESGVDKRIFYTRGPNLYAVDALTGNPILSFGDNGSISLRTGLGPTASKKYVASRTPGTIYEDLIIMPLSLSEGSDAALGNIQAFDTRTGKLVWVFETIPPPNAFGYETWPEEAYINEHVGAANNWAGMSVDRKRGILYVPTGSASDDFYGRHRIGSNLFANSLLALNARDGKRIWHYQFVHHDILDRDCPAPPNLFTAIRDGKKVDAVAQVTKQGYVFVFDRETGEPLFPIEEVEAPASDIPGEEAWPTQPVPTKPLPYARQVITTNDINPHSQYKDSLLTLLKKSRNEGPFTPLSSQGSIVYPGLDGGAEWGGAAVDPEGIMYLNSNEMAWLISLNKPKREIENIGQQIYAKNCATCHGETLRGNSASGFPSLVDIKTRFERQHVLDVITLGKGRMQGFQHLSDNEKKTLVAFLYGDKEADTNPIENKADTEQDLQYKINGYTKFVDKDGYPAIRPPWGTLNAIDLNTGEYVWKKVYGEYPELTAKGIPQTGSESYGGPVVTASGLLFIAGTKDSKLRAYDKRSGDLVWETQLPAASFATPSTYQVDGKQYIVLACGGGRGAPKGDSYVAFSLGD